MGFSNEAFELWYILHFQYLDSKLNRHQYVEVLNKIFMSKNEEKYKKNSHHIYDLLMKIGNQKKAIKFASKLAEIYNSENHSENKPTTSIYKLVESLNEYLKLK